MADFVDTTKAVDATSGSEEEDFDKKAKSKAARAALESVDGNGKFDNLLRFEKGNFDEIATTARGRRNRNRGR